MKKVACILAFGLFSATALAQQQQQPPPGANPHWGDDGLFDASSHDRPFDLSVMAWLDWYYGAGIGVQARFNIPIVKDGFIPSLNDEFDIEPSFGISDSFGYYDFSYVGISPAAYAIYAMHLTRAFRVYAGIGLGYTIGIASCDDCGTIGFSHFYWDPVVGLDFNLSRSFALRAELGSQGLKGGVQFYF